MSYFFDGSVTQIFLFENTYENCNPDYDVNMDDTSLSLIEKKSVKFDNAIAEKNKKFYDFITYMDDYFLQNPEDNNKLYWTNLKSRLLEYKEFDEHFFTNASHTLFLQEGITYNINYFEILNSFYYDFNDNYFEYYLMTQHLENISCCFLFTFRKLSKFVSRALNCKFFFCIFDKGVDNYIEDIDSLNFSYSTDSDGKITVNTSDVDHNLYIFDQYLTKRNIFISDLNDLYMKIFELLDKFIDFLTRVKVIIKIISIVSIIVNAHSDDNETIQEHINSITDLMRGLPPDTPATYVTKYNFYIDKYQKHILPFIVDLKVKVEKDRKLNPTEKEKFKNYLIGLSLGSAGMIGACQDLYSELNNYLSTYQDSKINYFSDKSEDEINEFLVNAYNPDNPDKLNPCYIIDYDNPPTSEELQEIYEDLNDTSDTTE